MDFITKLIKTTHRVTVALFCLSLVILASPSFASDFGGAGLQEGVVVQPPNGYARFCERHGRYCPRLGYSRPSAPVSYTHNRLIELVSINHAVNAQIRPVADRGGDHWTLNDRYGDCEEYALTKMRRLLEAGWPRSSLRITVVHNGTEYHAILVVEMDRAAFVLDNLLSYVPRTTETPYQFIVAESLHQPGNWVRVSK